jgi:hypothetical protein
MHYIRTSVVEDLILKAIQKVAAYVRSDEAGFIEKVRETSNLRAEMEVKENKKRLAKAERRCAELDTLVKKLYETYALGKLPETHFERMLSEYDAEQKDLRDSISNLRSEIDNYVADSVRAEKFIEIVSRYTEFEKLTVPMLNEFVEKVVVHEGEKFGFRRIQKMDIHLNFIGDFSVPEEPVVKTAEELEAERKLEENLERKRAQSRERHRRFRERKKLAQEA